jgi:hypothetical protein
MLGDEEWSNSHMGLLAFWRTGISVVNLIFSGLIMLKIFGVI